MQSTLNLSTGYYMKRYNLINNCLGWFCFVVAAVSYLLTLEPTASFWDCPEFILQAFKLEVGHPPGNPIFMLAARFFVNFAGGDISKIALMVNSMSALLSAGTILLLFWTITHLVRKLVVRDNASDISPLKMIVIFASGFCGAMMYAWSDTFWFSAVEGEVYAFSSFCTALVFWLILKWENRADQPHSDKYLILIAYVIGISIGVHLLNLLCIPAIVLVVYYRKWANTTAVGSLIALCISFVIVGLILYGLVPGFIEVSQGFELFCVNTLGMSFNMGVLIYSILLVASLIWCICCLYKQSNPNAIRISFLLSVILSGIPFIGDSSWVPCLIILGLGAYLWIAKKLPVRILNLAAISILVIFAGYSSYALLLIRSSAHPPMNQNAPDNVFALSSYLNREQYGERPLFYGETLNSGIVYEVAGDDTTTPLATEGKELYAKQVKTVPGEKDKYVMTGRKKKYVMTPELNMVLPRIYSAEHQTAYADWLGESGGRVTGAPVSATEYIDTEGNPLQKSTKIRPTFSENMQFLLGYQLNHMYWRYFMWNFAGRQNDIQGNGAVNQGNWISGIPFIDNPRLGDQSLLPDDQGEGNAGHNVFYMIPLLLGIIGLGWQAFTSKRGIEQFWVVFFLFFMTGIAIVLYLNQTPTQPRERDYAYAGSFYAFAIWVGMGVAGLWRLGVMVLRNKKLACSANDKEAFNEPEGECKRTSMICAVVAAVIGVAVPLQVVSQTWDDHDRSGRFTTRDFGNNYLESLDENAIIFTNGDNDTFPLWYAQEVEGRRTDVKVVNLSYLTTDWYVDQIRRPSYDAPGIDMQAKSQDYAYDRMQFAYFIQPDTTPTDARMSLRELYAPQSRQNSWGVPVMKHPVMYIPVDERAAIASGRVSAADSARIQPAIFIDMTQQPERGLRLSQIIGLDMISTSLADGWKRPVYFAMTVPDQYYLGLSPYLRNTGLAYEVTPLYNPAQATAINTDKMYRNITERFAWGGLDKVTKPGQVYLDETVRRMVTTHRSTMLDLAIALVQEGYGTQVQIDSLAHSEQELKQLSAYRDDRYNKARNILDLIRTKLPVEAMPYAVQVGQQIGEQYATLGVLTGNKADTETGLKIIRDEIERFAGNIVYYQSLNSWQYASLPRTDLYIDRYHLMELLQSYMSFGGDYDEIMKWLGNRGVNLARQQAFLQQQEQYRQSAELPQEIE